MFKIEWSSPEKIKIGSLSKWVRKFKIPTELLNGFFYWWKNNKIKFITDGFSVYKYNNEWYLTETKFNPQLFRNFGENQNNKNELPPDDGFVLTPVDVKNKEGLRPWQVNAVGYLIASINKWSGAIDGSQMGVGKTFTAGGLVRELGVNFVVVCPKGVISQWQDVIDNHFKLTDRCIGIINYEMLIRGKPTSNIASYIKNKSTQKQEFVWKLPNDSIIIFDEAHKLKNFKTQNSKVCIAAYKQGYRHLFLSASLMNSPLESRTVGTCLKMFKNSKEYYQFLRDYGCKEGMWGMEFNNDKEVLKRLHVELFKKRGIRLKRDEIPNFPECEIIVDPYDMDEENTNEINKIYGEMQLELGRIETKMENDKENELTIRTRFRQKCEMLKIPLIQEMVEDSIEAGMSVVVFLNYSDSIDALANRLNTDCIFDGRVGDKIREQTKKDFQSNKERVLIINSSAGGQGLSIGDESGEYPRISIISPDDSSTKMLQVQGRTNRENSKSKSIVKYVFIKGTIEENVANNVKRKLNNMEIINDNDLKI